MSTKRLNVLIYAGTGATTNSVRHATYTLRRLLGPNYAIITVTADQILKEPWTTGCALLVMPGGADLGYCRVLNGDGNRRIKQYVQMGGAYLGLCAGGYYGCAKCEFEVGNRAMEVVGDRELALFPGTCRGLAFPGFVYNSEAGARAVELVDGSGEKFKVYYNGGGVFVDAGKFAERGVEILAKFADELAVDAGEGGAAVVFCKVGEGRVVLTGPHPEFAPQNLERHQKNHPNYGALVDALLADETPRTAFLKTCLTRLGLEVSEEAVPVPSLSLLHLSAATPSDIIALVQTLRKAGSITKRDDGEECIAGENDTFLLDPPGRRLSMNSVARAIDNVMPQDVKDALPASVSSPATNSAAKENQSPLADPSIDRILDYNAVAKYLVPHTKSFPNPRETPYFNHNSFYTNLTTYNSHHLREAEGSWGKFLLYGNVVTSTNTLLEKNPTLLNHLPIGFTATATTQVAGRGRGTNVWVSPPGSLMFSTVMRHSIALSNSAPVVFIQYLAALAIVAGIKSYAPGYEKIPVRLKWPNDIYALDPASTKAGKETYVKIGGILVNSSYARADYTLVVGIGMNVNNSAPSVSLSQLAILHKLHPFTLEKLLASILTHFEELYTRFCRTGFDAEFEKMYYESWLHTDQIVTLEAEGGAKAKIKGITKDWGLLVAEEVSWDGGRGTGKRWELQSDSNSFDFLKGLLRRKV